MKRRMARLQIDHVLLMTNLTAKSIGYWLQSLPFDTKLVNFSQDISTNSLSMIFESNTFKEIEEYDTIPNFTVDSTGNLDLSQVLEPLNSGQALQALNNAILPNQTPFITKRRGYQLVSNGKFWGATASPLDTDALKRAQEEINKLHSDMQNNGKDYKTLKKEHEWLNCDHKWTTYVGLHHTDTFCIKCNKVQA